MTDQELARRARGRARRERRRLRRKRNAAIALILFFTFGVFATSAFDLFEPARRIGPPLPIRARIHYPALSLLDQSIMLQPSNILLESSLPQLVDIQEIVPSHSDSRDEPPLPEEPDRPDVMMLDDFEAAPAKRAFLASVVETTRERGRGEIQTGIDEVDFLAPTYQLGPSGSSLGGSLPVVPEPGTGVLVGIGLLTLSIGRRKQRPILPLRVPGGGRNAYPRLAELLLTALLVLSTGGCAHVDRVFGTEGDSAEGSALGGDLIARYREEAEAGFAKAQYNLGLSYFYGEGIAQDKTVGIEWYRKAAEQSIAAAQYNLAIALVSGDGVESNPQEAVKWFTAAAKLGDADSQFNLGLLRLEGKNVEKDPEAAVHWFTQAAGQGYAKAEANLGVAYAKGRGIARDDTLAAEWFEKAAEHDHAQAQFNLAQAYEFGVGVSSESAQAAYWYERAAEQGIPGAQFHAGLAYLGGLGVEQDSVAAYKWLALAAAAGYAEAREPIQELEQSLSDDDLSIARKHVQKWNLRQFHADGS
jgi:TPR repeat protein